ncbi:MAG: dihydroorotate dehydrogenase electron transfer subunit [Clostridia bacterium]|nr:dihydroorotate dehydrogenase electron transfer subunit [Clostridia bacterium]
MNFRITENKQLTALVWSMVLEGEASGVVRPGQFVQVQLPGFYLRRPISVCQWDDTHIRLVYKVVGEGTDKMTTLKAGETLDILTGLGNGFDVDACGDRPLLVGGGVGLPPMIGLCEALIKAGKHPVMAAGFAKADEIFLQEEIEKMGVPFLLATMDGSAGVQGTVIDAIRGAEYDSVCACGPLPMLKALYEHAEVPGQFSFEERMGCGFGACMGCTVKTKNGYKRICKEGPVLDREEILW